MKEKGVREDLLIELGEDPGFAKFCTEWISQKCTEEPQIPDTNKLNQIIKRKQTEINTMRIQYRAVKDTSLTENENILDIAVINETLKCFKLGSPIKMTQGILRLNASKQNSFNFIKAIGHLNCSHWSTIYLFLLKRKQKETKLILKKSSFINVGKLNIINKDTRLSRLAIGKIGYYYKDLLRILPQVAKSVSFKKFEISQKQFEKIMYLCRDKQDLSFYECIIDLSNAPNLSRSVQNSQLEKLCFEGCGLNYTGHWKQNPNHLQNLFVSLSPSRFPDSNLKNILLNKTGLSKNSVLLIARQHNIDHLINNIE
ncbi:unnamed protein product [Moneuplotes crassus]|uniref:Uncharacterized protein n=1 Tax=Euplotes crassus TaxID=5936 RepID=A0AAD2D0Z3_EUPCR|nr:unnamed protein product [Moneuplotes crassus]